MMHELPSASTRDSLVRATVFVVAVSGMILGGPLKAQGFLVSPIICSTSSHVSKRLERTGLPPASFSTFSSSGLSIGSTFQALGRQVANDIGEFSCQRGSWRSGAMLGVLFYAIGEGMAESDNVIEHALAGLNTQLPFVGSIIGESQTPSPTLPCISKLKFKKSS